MVRSHLELALGKISFKEYVARWTDFLKNKWQNVDELITFNNVKQVPSTFFIGVKRGVGLSYSNDLAAVWMNQIINRGADLNIHGINFSNVEVIQEERDLFFVGYRREGKKSFCDRYAFLFCWFCLFSWFYFACF